MPTGYAGRGKTYSKILHKWIDKKTTAAFDYEGVPHDSVGFLISFFRYYIDYYLDVLRSPSAEFKLELPQRLMLRAMCRYRNVYITGTRGLTKTYCVLLYAMAQGTLYPGEVMKYCAPNQKQAATLANQAFHQIEKDYPALANMWQIRNDRDNMFRITTRYGSEFSMYAPRGSNASISIAEEIGAEGANSFDMTTYENDVLPIVRMERKVNQKKDPTHVDSKHLHISNACSKQNRAYTVHRYKVLHDMLYGERFSGFVIDIPWEVSLIGGIRSINYIKDQKAQLTTENFMRELCARYTGANENPIVSDETLSRSRTLMVMEEQHCGDPSVIYVVAHDVSYEDGARNAKCADAVIKLTRFKSKSKRDKYRKQVVYVDTYPPPKTAYLQAQKLKAFWRKYCMNGGGPTYLIVDARAYGREIVEELMKPTNDGIPPLCCYKHMKMTELEQPGALPIIYPLQAGTRGATDEEGEMLRYSQVEFEQGNVELLTATVTDGVEQYKRKHGIKDDLGDSRISIPYRKTEELCQQIQNLVLKESGLTLKETRKSKYLPRDLWSAVKYGLRFARILEQELLKAHYTKRSSWSDAIASYKQTTDSLSSVSPMPISAVSGLPRINRDKDALHVAMANARAHLGAIRRR